MNPENPDPKKLGIFNTIVIDGLTIRQGTIKRSLEKFMPMMKPHSNIVLISREQKNEMNPE